MALDYELKLSMKKNIGISQTKKKLQVVSKQVGKYNYIIVLPKVSWVGLICRTHQNYNRQ